MTIYKCYIRQNHACTNIFEHGESIQDVTAKLIEKGYTVIRVVKVRI